MNWEERKAAYTTKAKTLADVPKDLKYFSKFNTLKMAAMEKIEADIKSGKINKEDASELHTIRDAKDTFGFTERYVNVLMEYAYREAMDYMQKDYIARTKEMNEAFNKIVGALEEVDMIPENCNCDY
jgi:uncharacterized protein YutD